jgi:hypothetical protein
MNPEQDQQSPTSARSYLDQIAPVETKKPIILRLGPVQMIVGGIILIMLILLVVSIVSSVLKAPLVSLQQLSARLATTATLVEDASDNLNSTELRTLNGNLKIYLTNTNREIVEPFQSVGVSTAKIDASITKQESGTAIAARLEDARLNAVYDRTYAREMSYQLDTILNLMKKSHSSIGNAKVKVVLESAYENLAPIQQDFADFNETAN